MKLKTVTQLKLSNANKIRKMAEYQQEQNQNRRKNKRSQLNNQNSINNTNNLNMSKCKIDKTPNKNKQRILSHNISHNNRSR